jgi:hypothetical protein
MRILIFSLFVGLFMAAPVLLYRTCVEPSLMSLRTTYAGAGAYADRVAEGN